MRKCIRCGTAMMENYTIKLESSGYGITIATDDEKILSKIISAPKIAICPGCGEISFYIDNTGALK